LFLLRGEFFFSYPEITRFRVFRWRSVFRWWFREEFTLGTTRGISKLLTPFFDFGTGTGAGCIIAEFFNKLLTTATSCVCPACPVNTG